MNIALTLFICLLYASFGSLPALFFVKKRKKHLPELKETLPDKITFGVVNVAAIVSILVLLSLSLIAFFAITEGQNKDHAILATEGAITMVVLAVIWLAYYYIIRVFEYLLYARKHIIALAVSAAILLLAVLQWQLLDSGLAHFGTLQ